MPIRALNGEEDILAFDYDQKSWETLKSVYKEMKLSMPCCGNKAIPKTSKLGNFYFSHSVRGDCTSEAESQEHLYVKALVAKSAKESGWDVKTEWQGSTPTGEGWVADVYCEKGNSKIALEIQLSRQTKDETIDRQNRYALSGVRCAWLASNSVFDEAFIPQNKQTPFFLISKPIVGQIPKVISFNIKLDSFIKKLLSKKITWTEEAWVYDLNYIDDKCWKCKKDNKQVFGYRIDVYGDRAKTVPNASSVMSKISEIVTNQELNNLGLNSIGKFEKYKGKIIKYPYCNVCIHCGAPQNNFYLMEKLKSTPDKYVEFQSKKQFTGKWVLNEP